MLLYQNLILRNQGKIQESVDHFDKFMDIMTDKLKVKEIKGIVFCFHATENINKQTPYFIALIKEFFFYPGGISEVVK